MVNNRPGQAEGQPGDMVAEQVIRGHPAFTEAIVRWWRGWVLSCACGTDPQLLDVSIDLRTAFEARAVAAEARAVAAEAGIISGRVDTKVDAASGRGRSSKQWDCEKDAVETGRGRDSTAAPPTPERGIGQTPTRRSRVRQDSVSHIPLPDVRNSIGVFEELQTPGRGSHGDFPEKSQQALQKTIELKEQAIAAQANALALTCMLLRLPRPSCSTLAVGRTHQRRSLNSCVALCSTQTAELEKMVAAVHSEGERADAAETALAAAQKEVEKMCARVAEFDQ